MPDGNSAVRRRRNLVCPDLLPFAQNELPSLDLPSAANKAAFQTKENWIVKWRAGGPPKRHRAGMIFGDVDGIGPSWHFLDVGRTDSGNPTQNNGLDRKTETMTGIEWLIEALGCDEARLRDKSQLSSLLETIIHKMQLRPVGGAVWHVFEGGGGATGIWLLQESHLAIHTFPEYQSACVNIFCCTPRAPLDWRMVFCSSLGANDVRVRECERVYNERS